MIIIPYFSCLTIQFSDITIVSSYSRLTLQLFDIIVVLHNSFLTVHLSHVKLVPHYRQNYYLAVRLAILSLADSYKITDRFSARDFWLGDWLYAHVGRLLNS
jgi:hypothetical protein